MDQFQSQQSASAASLGAPHHRVRSASPVYLHPNDRQHFVRRELHKPVKSRFKYRFELTVGELLLPENISTKLGTSTQFYILWKRARDAPLRTEAITITDGKLEWKEVLTLTTVLIKNRQTDTFHHKDSRLLLKQVKAATGKESTVGSIKINLSDYIEKKEEVKLEFTKCNIPDVYLTVSMNAVLEEEEDYNTENGQAIDDDTASVYSRYSEAIEDMSLMSGLRGLSGHQYSNSLPDIPSAGAPSNVSNGNRYFTDMDAMNMAVTTPPGTGRGMRRPQHMRAFTQAGYNMAGGQTTAGRSPGARAYSVILGNDSISSQGYGPTSAHPPNAHIQGALEKEIKDLKKSISKLEQRLENKNKEINLLHEENMDSKRKYDDFKNKSRSAVNDIREKKLASEEKVLKLRLEVNQLSDEYRKLKEENQEMRSRIGELEEQNSKQTIKYADLLSVLHSDNKDKTGMKKRVADLCRQNDDLEHTLVMIRNSWTQTGHVMENEVTYLKNQISELEKEAERYKYDYEALKPEYDLKEKLIDQLQHEKIVLEAAKSDIQLKSAAKSVENTQYKNQLADANAKIEKLRGLIFQLVQGFKNDSEQPITIVDQNTQMQNPSNVNHNGMGIQNAFMSDLSLGDIDLQTLLHQANATAQTNAEMSAQFYAMKQRQEISDEEGGAVVQPIDSALMYGSPQRMAQDSHFRVGSNETDNTVIVKQSPRDRGNLELESMAEEDTQSNDSHVSNLDTQ